MSIRVRSLLIGGMTGFLIGCVLAAVAAAAFWIITFARALGGEAVLEIPGVIGVVEREDGVRTSIGPLLLLSPFLCGALFAVLGALIASRWPRKNSRPVRAA